MDDHELITRLAKIENLLDRILHNQTSNGVSYDAQQMINLQNSRKAQQGLSANMFKQGVSDNMTKGE